MASSSSAPIVDLPIGIDGVCMICKVKPSVKETMLCALCATPWHSAHLLLPTLPQTNESITSWECPDCNIPADGNERPQVIAINASTTDLLISIKEIETDPSLTDDQKAKQKQAVMGGKQQLKGADRDDDICDDILELLGANFKCSFCMHLLERPVTTPCGHNFCLKCFQRWTVNKKKILVYNADLRYRIR
ncbi:hypothetical protein ZOSMA_2G00690 [Zostera marina]|uniref:RING-type domain-containing protein n=1 Tax=Zostera marina TaxID=29655 RepID=A0A0K9PCU3_ZOSMR|nr:hypothetical protein ZOSMA_2G00690 [Zostera marina]